MSDIVSNCKENQGDVKKEKKIVHILCNICLLFSVFVVVLMCGFIPSSETAHVVKTYNGVIYAGNENSGKVAIMINVYWGTEYLNGMLDTLAKHNAKATFFVGETWARENPEMLKKIYAAGHEIGNHGSNHKDHKKLSHDASYSEIAKCHATVKSILNIEMNLFAPPGGGYNKATISSAQALLYKTILWTHDTVDWRDQSEDQIFSRATAEAMAGDLILMHPTRATSAVLEKIILAINGKNLALDTVSNTIKD